MKILMRIALAVFLLTGGFTAGFPIGRNKGFSTGSERAFAQANLFDRKAGPFRVILKQPKHLLIRNASLRQ
jgi:hypothetical protein